MAQTIESWRELTGKLEKYRRHGYLYRGERDDSRYTLRPKVGRVSKSPGSARKYDYCIEDEKRVFEDFKRAARPYIAHEPKSEIEWLAIAQHHGLPTRLLDWTESLLVAAYFAVKNTQSAGVIYCVHGLDSMPGGQENNIFEPNEVRAYRPPHLSPRIPVQQSVFTLHPNPERDFTHANLERWTIAQTACWDIKQCLSTTGITPASLFPGIDGLSQHLAWLYKWAYFPADSSGRL